jgi:hypothetical protein
MRTHKAEIISDQNNPPWEVVLTLTDSKVVQEYIGFNLDQDKVDKINQLSSDELDTHADLQKDGLPVYKLFDHNFWLRSISYNG